MVRYLSFVFLLSMVACVGESEEDPLVIYAAVDRATAEPLLEAWEEETGVRTRVVFDSEAAKTVGLAKRLELERQDPRADVWWSGEAFYTCLLEGKGCLETWPSEIEIPKRHTEIRSDHWVGFGVRLRVLVYREDLWPAEVPLPSRFADLADPRLEGRVILSRPHLGTAATHAAHLASTEDGRALLERVKGNGAMVAASNSQVVRAVSKGQALLGLTDTDDVLIAMEDDPRLRWVVPDQGPDGGGAIATPATVAMVKGCRQPDRARAFMAFLLSNRGESLLAGTGSRNFPLGEGATPPQGLPPLSNVHIVALDYAALVERWEQTSLFLEELFSP